ncbi:MAG: tetratricopeptide repeat protein, partial [Candidatus Tyrphobacter sp.]
GHADHVAYYIVGTYWVNCILAPAVPIGAYLLFSRFLPAVPSAVAAWFFCTETLGNKVWSLRGETIGWIVGFCFLLAVVDAVRGLEDSKTARSCARLWPLVGTLFFALVLTHGIAAAIAVIAVAFAGVHVLLRRNLYAVIPIVRLAAFAGICTVVLLTVFALTYAHSTSVIEKGVHSPAGAQDAAIAHDNAWDGLPLDFDPRPVHVHPPYVPLPAMAEIVAILPPVSLFEPSYRSLPIEVFPRLAITELATVPAGVKILVAALPLVLLALCFALPTQRKRWRELFLISLCVCAVLVLVSLFADLRSVALYPVAAVRRSFPYVRFFYWVAIGIAVAEYLELLLRRWAGAEQAWLAARKRVLPGIAALVVSFGWIFSSLNIAVGRTTLGAMLGHVGWGTLAVIDPLLPLTPFEVQETPMLQTMLYVRDHVPIGHWVFSNILSSDDTFSYFTSGRYSLLEGTSIYQLSPLLRREAIDMRTMEIVAASSDTALLKPFGSAYVVTYDRLQCDAQCYGDIVVPTNDSWFASSPALKRVFSNGYYTIYRTTGASDLRVAAQDARLITRCEAWSAEPTATIAACERLVRLSGPIDPAAYYFLARAQLARHQYAAAIEDFNDSIATSPQFALSYYGRALTFAREGRRHEALADLDLAATYGGNEVRIEALRRTLLGAAASDP